MFDAICKRQSPFSSCSFSWWPIQTSIFYTFFSTTYLLLQRSSSLVRRLCRLSWKHSIHVILHTELEEHSVERILLPCLISLFWSVYGKSMRSTTCPQNLTGEVLKQWSFVVSYPVINSMKVPVSDSLQENVIQTSRQQIF